MPEKRLERTRESYENRIKCPHCSSKNIITIYRPTIYEFPYLCRDCDKGFN